MFDLSIPLQLIISFIIGAVIGLERESPTKKSEQPPLVGLRTFSLITTLGTLTGFLIDSYPIVFLLIGITIMTLTIAYYVLQSLLTKDLGITTEIAIIFSYLLGILIAINYFPMTLIIAISVVLILILSRKTEIKKIIGGIQREEVNAFISFALIALVILPFLPNQGFKLSDIPLIQSLIEQFGFQIGKFASIEIINPFKLWLIVALITGIDMAGYLLERTIGQKHGRLLASIVGGVVSSTATTQSLAQESKNHKLTNRLVAAAAFANVASFFPIFVLIGSTNSSFLTKATPALVGMIISGTLAGLFFLRKRTNAKDSVKKRKAIVAESEIFAMGPALKFALLFSVIRVITQISLVIFGQSGFLITSALASLTGIDAVTINISQLAGSQISTDIAVITLLVVNAVNLTGKTFYSFLQGKREFAVKLSFCMAAIVGGSLLGLLFM